MKALYKPNPVFLLRLYFFVTVGTDYSIVLKEVGVSLWENERCERRLQQRFSSNYRLATSAFCADDRGVPPNPNVCDGDGGRILSLTVLLKFECF